MGKQSSQNHQSYNNIPTLLCANVLQDQVDWCTGGVLGWLGGDPGNGLVVVASSELVAQVPVRQVTQLRGRVRCGLIEGAVIGTSRDVQSAVFLILQVGVVVGSGVKQGSVDI